MQCILHVLEDAAEKGQRTLSLGPGDQEYKVRLADDASELVSWTLVPRGPGYVRARGRLLAGTVRDTVRHGVAGALPQSLRRALRAAR
jgi:CelD/BcsL family acetyltransferase involved in cellulose biosynthesis